MYMYGVNVVAVVSRLSLYCLIFCHLLTGPGLQSYATVTPKMATARATECRPGMYCRRAIGTLSELRRGDHIRVDRGVYHHHMMVVDAVSANEVTVIHYTGVENLEKVASETEGCDAASSMAVASSFNSFSFSGGQTLGEIKEETLPISPRQVQVLEYKDNSQVKYSVDESLKRARSRLGEKEYNVVTNNCEHLVNWAKTGVSQSSQSQAGGRAALRGFEAGWQAGKQDGFGWGVLVGVASAAKSYLQDREGTHE